MLTDTLMPGPVTRRIVAVIVLCASGAVATGAQTANDQPEQERTRPASTAATADSHTLLDARDRIFYPGDTERLKPLGHKLLSNVLLDEREIFTSPLHINRQDAKWWLMFGGATAGLIASDHHIANAFENSKGQVAWGGRVSKIGASYTLIPLIAGFYGYGAWKDQPKAREVGVLGTEALVDGLITVEILKTFARRSRPDEKQPGEFWDGGSSFPSGHAMESWAIASLMAHEYSHYKIVPIVAYGLAATISGSRIAARRHFASDVVAGGAMGWFIGRYVYRTHMSHLSHKHAWLRPTLMPQMDPGSQSYGVTVAFGGLATPVHVVAPGDSGVPETYLGR